MRSKNLLKKLPILIIILDVVIAGVVMVYIASAIWNKPLGPSLGAAGIASAQEVGSGSSMDMPPGEGDALSLPSETPASLLDQIASLLKPGKKSVSSNSVQTLCGGPPVMTILVIGSDQRGHDYLYGLADTIRIVRVDFAAPKVMVLDIPRDLWVEIPEISEHYGISVGKLNQAYFYGNPGMGYYEGEGEGPGLLARTLELNYGLEVDHYLAMDRETFSRFIDAIGGIDVHLDSKVDFNELQDGANPDYVLAPGSHHLDGVMALKLASHRYPTTFHRARYQNIVLEAVQDKVLTPAMITQIPELATLFINSVQTDLSPNEISQLGCLATNLNGDNTQYVAFPDDMFTSERTYDPYRQVNTFTLGVDNAEMRAYISDFMQGNWP